MKRMPWTNRRWRVVDHFDGRLTIETVELGGGQNRYVFHTIDERLAKYIVLLNNRSLKAQKGT